jgi:hypothetical protein
VIQSLHAEKNKKQKIKTKEQRHKKEYIPQQSNESPNILPIFSFNKTSSVHISTEEKDMFKHVRADLIKTTVLAGICIGVLITLSYILK